jgi:hypothetical protein
MLHRVKPLSSFTISPPPPMTGGVFSGGRGPRRQVEGTYSCTINREDSYTGLKQSVAEPVKTQLNFILVCFLPMTFMLLIFCQGRSTTATTFIRLWDKNRVSSARSQLADKHNVRGWILQIHASVSIFCWDSNALSLSSDFEVVTNWPALLWIWSRNYEYINSRQKGVSWASN